MITLSAVFGAALFSLVFKTSDFISARASNVNVLSVQTEEITASNYEMYSSSGAPLQIGDYALHFVIHNNTGYAGMGLSAFYDNTIFEIYCSDNALLQPYFIQGSASAGLLLICYNNAATGCIGFSTAGLHNCIHDGIIVTVFAARKPDAEDEETPLLGYLGELTDFNDSDTVGIEEHEEEVTQETEYRIMREILYYRLGDINGDGIVDTDDAVILLNILNQYGTITEANAAQAFANCAGMFATDMLGDPVFILDAAHRPCACLQKNVNRLTKICGYAILKLEKCL